MNTKEQKKKIGLFYHRDSGGEHQQTPPQYVKWGIKTAKELGVEFKAKPDDIKKLMTSGKPFDSNIFFDYKVEGDAISRPALNALFEKLQNSNGEFSHVFICDPDRLCRPDDPLDGIALENKIRRFGVAIVYKNKTLHPIKRGEQHDIAEIITGVVAYDRAGGFLHGHAEKMVSAKIESAEKCHWTGGRPGYGFRRWLVEDNGTQVRTLDDGETVRQKGHHIEALPDEEAMKIVKRILKMLQKQSASEVCRVLNQEGVPSPDASTLR